VEIRIDAERREGEIGLAQGVVLLAGDRWGAAWGMPRRRPEIVVVATRAWIQQGRRFGLGVQI